MPGRQAAEWCRRTSLGEGLQRGHGASKPPAGRTVITTKRWVQLGWYSTGELGVTEEAPASLKTIESEEIEYRFKVGGRPTSEVSPCRFESCWCGQPSEGQMLDRFLGRAEGRTPRQRDYESATEVGSTRTGGASGTPTTQQSGGVIIQTGGSSLWRAVYVVHTSGTLGGGNRQYGRG